MSINRTLRTNIGLLCVSLLSLGVSGAGCSSDESTGAGHPQTSTQPPDKGSLDVVNDREIAGWVWDRANPGVVLKVDIYDGDKLLTTVTADRLRKDLLDKGVGDGRHGFSYPTPADLKDAQAHIIHAMISGTKTELKQSPKTFTHKAP